MKSIGTMSVGIKAPVIRSGDDLVSIVTESVIKAVRDNGLLLKDRDIVAVTEAIVGKSQKNFASVDQIAKDVRQKFKGGTVGVVFPILSRNRFSLLLKGISMGCDKVVIQLSYPTDEVGNPICKPEKLNEANINPYSTSLDEKQFREIFKDVNHPFTGIDYISAYKDIAGPNTEIIFSNNPTAILNYTKKVLAADIHTRENTKKALKKAGAEIVYGLDDILSKSVDGSGFHPKYGLLGSNMSTENVVKLFPKDAQKFVEDLQKAFYKKTGKKIECMVYGDGAFKDPAQKIWELADPVVSPGFTKGLIGTPNEVKFKYIADNLASGKSQEEAQSIIINEIKNKEKNNKSKRVSLGTTPRNLTDLIGSLADLTSGSGDKGTPIVLIKNYFDSYAD